jgi:hypothetical protein
VGRLTVLVTLLVGCTADEGRPPLARIVMTPDTILENDGFQTAVTLDGTTSADPIDDPAGTGRLTYAWTIEGDEVRFEEGRATSPKPVIRLRGDRPATISLTVTDADGLEATVVAHMRLSVR